MRKQNESYLSTYLHTKGRKLGIPVAGNFELTARCNFHCPMCYVHMTEEEIKNTGSSELTAKQWISLAEAAKDKGMVFALLTGGEPFVRKDFFEIYGAMKKMGLVVSINSNGSMLEGKVLDQLLKDPPARINISLYGGCNETYERMCGRPVFDKVLRNMDLLKENGVDVKMNLSITPYNCKDISEIYKIAEEHEIQVKASSYMYPPARLDKELEGYGNRFSPKDSGKYSVAWDLLRFKEEEWKQRVETMGRLKAMEQEECSIDMDAGVGCRAGATTFWITWDGLMRPCGMMPYPTAYPLEQGFDAAWEQIRRDTEKIRRPKKCVSCAKREICGACAAVCVAETGAFDQTPTYMCERTEEILKETLQRKEKLDG